MSKYILYLNLEDAKELEFKGKTFTTSNHITSVDDVYKQEMRRKVTNELLDPGDKLLILTTRGETHITIVE